ncbi:MAG: hypothetical protein IKX96_00415, partial [Firmicutes bacterium]|nr:hypothetical protein [Bacillota bacterium]
EELASKIDREVRRILDEQYERTITILTDHHDELERVALGLMDLETIDEEQFEALYQGTKTSAELKEEQDAQDAAQKAADEAEAARKKAEAKNKENEIKKALSEGKRIAVLDKDGRLVIRKPAEPKPEEQAAPAETPAQPAAETPTEQKDTTDDKAPEENKE